MKIPAESYLIPGENVHYSEETCFFAFTGYIPDRERSVVLGQAFIQNYLTVLDNDNMKIGIGAHMGADTAI